MDEPGMIGSGQQTPEVGQRWVRRDGVEVTVTLRGVHGAPGNERIRLEVKAPGRPPYSVDADGRFFGLDRKHSFDLVKRL